MKPTTKQQQMYNKFCDSLINANGLDTDPKTRKEAKKFISFKAYMGSGKNRVFKAILCEVQG